MLLNDQLDWGSTVDFLGRLVSDLEVRHLTFLSGSISTVSTVFAFTRIYILNRLDKMKKIPKRRQKQQERKNAVLLLRFRTEQPDKNAVKYCSYQKIGRIVNLSYNEVQYICRRALKLATKRSKPKDTSRQLE